MADEKILGIEGGGTKTAWALVVDGAIVESGKLPPSNLRLTPLDQMTKIFRVLPREVDRIGVFLAGCATEEDRVALLKLARAVWPKANIVAGSDRDSGMAACLRDRDGIAVNAGTGSSVTGRSGRRIEKAGGWGHILGDTAGVSALVDFTTAVSLRLQLEAPEVRLMGGLFEHQKFYGVAFTTALNEKVPAAKIGPCESPPEVGAAWLAAAEGLQIEPVKES